MANGDCGDDIEGDDLEVDAEQLRHQLVDYLRARAVVTTTPVENALRAVPRHLFLPGVPLPQAYADDAVVTRRDEAGMPSSSASQPAIVAIMLEQLELAPGMRVLEIGAGTGYNAALLATMVGAGGSVTTVDIDPEVVEGARANLDRAGLSAVRVECGDGGLGYAPGAPYDRTIVTVGAWDLPPAWFDQLGVDGRLVVPLGLRGPQCSICFERAVAQRVAGAPSQGPVTRTNGVRTETWQSRSIVACGFMQMRGGFAGPARMIGLGDDNSLWLEDDRHIDVDAIQHALAEPARDHRTGTLVTAREVWTSLSLWLALTDADYVRLHLPESLGAGALVDGESLAIAVRSTAEPADSAATAASATSAVEDPARSDDEEPEQFEITIRASGPRGAVLARRLADSLAAWQQAGRPATEHLRIDAHPAGTPDEEIRAQYVIDKLHTRLGVSFGQV